MRGLIFLASFISPPLVISKFAAFLPISLLKSNALNRYLMSKLGFAGAGSQYLVEQVFNSLDVTNKIKLKQRLSNISQLDNPAKVQSVPCVYIQPSQDYLVGQKAVATLAARFNYLAVRQLTGGHFIAQSAPKECAKIMLETIAVN